MAHLRGYKSFGTIPSASGAAIAALKARAAAWDVPLIETTDHLILSVWGCELRLTAHSDSMSVDLSAPEQRLIGNLRDSATELFAEIGLAVAWDHVDAGALAPGLSLMQLRDLRQISPNFIRVRLAGPDAARFAEGSYHFRLLLPPQGRTAIWPRVQDNGRVGWPEGKDALHRAVYNVAAQSEDWLDFDIFRHANSPTCDWTAQQMLDQTVGIIGPGGGGCPNADRIHLFGDETALPAIRRILTESPARVTAQLRCHPDDLGALRHDPRVSLSHDLRGDLADSSVEDGDFIWFAASAEEARLARKDLLARGVAKRDMLVAAYWS